MNATCPHPKLCSLPLLHWVNSLLQAKGHLILLASSSPNNNCYLLFFIPFQSYQELDKWEHIEITFLKEWAKIQKKKFKIYSILECHFESIALCTCSTSESSFFNTLRWRISPNWPLCFACFCGWTNESNWAKIFGTATSGRSSREIGNRSKLCKFL